MTPSAYIPSPSSSGFHLGPFFIHAYGLAYVVAVTSAIVLTRALWKHDGGDPKLPQELAIWAFPAGLIGGRIYFLITTPSQIPPHWWGPFAIWKGGLGSWGGIAGGVLVGVWMLRRRLDRAQVRRFMDVAAPGLLLATSCVRVGNYFNQELFGKPTTLPWGLKIDQAHQAGLPLRFQHAAAYQPTFLYEIIFNLLLAAVLVWLARSRRVRPPGVFALYVAGYSGYRIFEETLRIDYSNYVLGMRLNFWIASVMCVIGLLWFVAIQRQWRLPLLNRARRSPSGSRTPAASDRSTR